MNKCKHGHLKTETYTTKNGTKLCAHCRRESRRYWHYRQTCREALVKCEISWVEWIQEKVLINEGESNGLCN